MKARIRFVTVVSALICAGPAMAGGSEEHFADSLEHSAQAIASATVGSFKLVSGAAAVPLMMIGSVGAASGELGEALWDEANAPIGTPLEVTDDVITVGPAPADAMAAE